MDNTLGCKDLQEPWDYVSCQDDPEQSLTFLWEPQSRVIEHRVSSSMAGCKWSKRSLKLAVVIAEGLTAAQSSMTLGVSLSPVWWLLWRSLLLEWLAGSQLQHFSTKFCEWLFTFYCALVRLSQTHAAIYVICWLKCGSQSSLYTESQNPG